jgi:FixJ family two-component response regulator
MLLPLSLICEKKAFAEIVQASFLFNIVTVREIAAILHISKKTIEVHRYNNIKKLKLRNTAALIYFINKNYHDLD